MTARGQKNKWWTPGQERELARLRAGGVPVREIAARLGRTVNAVWKQVHYNRRRYPARGSRLHAWYEALQVVHTLRAVAARMGVGVRTVQRWKSRLRAAGYEVGPATREDGRPPRTLRFWGGARRA